MGEEFNYYPEIEVDYEDKGKVETHGLRKTITLEKLVEIIENNILQHGEYLPTVCEDSGQPEWCVREIKKFRGFLAKAIMKALKDDKENA